MNNDLINQFLLNNGKHFPKNKIGKITTLLNSCDIKHLYFDFTTPFRGILITWLTAPFDRLLLGKIKSGILKVLLFTLCVYTPFRMNDMFFYIHIPFTSSDLQIGTEMLFISWIIFIIWQFYDLATIRARVKEYNCKKLIKHIKNNCYTSKAENADQIKILDNDLSLNISNPTINERYSALKRQNAIKSRE